MRYEFDLYFIPISERMDHNDNSHRGGLQPSVVRDNNEAPNESNDCRRSQFISFMRTKTDDQGLQQAYDQLVRCEDEEEIRQILSEYLSKKLINAILGDVYVILGKARTRQLKINLLYKDLFLKKVSPQDIDKLRQFQKAGKRYRLYRLLQKLVGTAVAPQMFEEYQSEIIEQESKPLENAKPIEENQPNHPNQQLPLYKYPEEQADDLQRDMAKTVLVLGETGSGKSSFINTMVNYLAGIEIDDKFRYKVVIEDKQNNKDSVTDNISQYYVKNQRNNKVYKIYDTPGFGDTKGKLIDDDTKKKLLQMIKTDQIKEVHAVLLVIKSSNNRLNEFHKYIFESVKELFGKDIVQNFTYVFTFYDSSSPLAIQSVRDEKDGFGNYWSAAKEPRFIKANNCRIFAPVHTEAKNEENELIEKFWNITMDGIEKLFEKVDNATGNTLKGTKEMIELKQQLIRDIQAAQAAMQTLKTKYDESIQQLQKIAEFSQEINQNKKFQYHHTITTIQLHPSERNVLKCKRCLEVNCHLNCEDIQSCPVFDSQRCCTSCTNKCPMKVHQVSRSIRRRKKMVVTETNNTLREKYMMAESNMATAEFIFEKIIEDLEIIIQKSIGHAKDIIDKSSKLSEVCLSKRKEQSVEQYFYYMKQQMKKIPGKQNKVELFELVFHELQIRQKFEESLLKNFCLAIIQMVRKSKEDLNKKKQYQQERYEKQRIAFNKKATKVFVTRAQVLGIEEDKIDTKKLLKTCKSKIKRRQEIKRHKINQRMKLAFF